VIDIYYKIKALSSLGTEIILHCYQYGRERSRELEELCSEVHYYDRDKGMKYFFNSRPYIVNTRSDENLLSRLLKDNHPVLFEGIHTSFFAAHPGLAGRTMVLRAHNIEHEYYKGLARAEKNLSKRVFYLTEAIKLGRYEKTLPGELIIAAISDTDADYFRKRFSRVFHLPPFHAYEKLNCQPGVGDYLLFHGDLSVPENIASVIYLVKNIFGKISYKVVIAGKNPQPDLINYIKRFSNIRLEANPSENEMNNLIRNAQINILHTFQASGIKLKLISALFNGRHCLVNPEIIHGSGLDDLCYVIKDSQDAINLIPRLMDMSLEIDEIDQRRTILSEKYSNLKNARILLDII
jgi:hypothetical protein